MITPVERRYFSAAERLDRAQLEALQFRKLKRLLEYNYRHNAFYRDLWMKAGVLPDDIHSLADYRRRVPTIQKSDVLKDQMEHPPLGRRVGVPLEQIRKIHLTSGTSGMAKEAWGLTAADVELAGRGHIQHFHWRGLTPGDIFVSSMPKFFSAGHGAVWGAEKAGLIPFELFGMPTERAFETMRQFPPAMFLFPQAPLQRMIAQAGMTAPEAFPKLKAIAATGGGDRLAAQADYWQARVFDNYGCTQAGNTIGIACEAGVGGKDASPMIHFLEERYLVECLDRETGEPCEPHGECEVILTTLDRVASPAIRYRLHDRLTFMPFSACSCGRPFHGYIPGSIGRWDDMMKVKGVNIWPHLLDELIMAHGEVFEYRGIVTHDQNTDMMTIQIGFADSAPASSAWRQDFLDRLRTTVKHNTFVTPDVVEATEKFGTFDTKPRRWSDQRQRVGAGKPMVGVS